MTKDQLLFLTDTKKWKQGENPNTYFNKKLEALYFYPMFAKYWEDVRSPQTYVIINLN